MKLVKNSNAHNENGAFDYTACFFTTIAVSRPRTLFINKTHGCYNAFS